MIYLILAVVSSSLVSVIMRLSGKYIKNNTTMLSCNYVMCSLLSLIYMGSLDVLPLEEGIGFALGLGLISGILYLGCFILMQWNVHKNGVALSSTFMKLGIVVPTIMSILLFREKPTYLQVIGLIIAFFAIIFINMEKGEGKNRNAFGLIALFLGGGICDACSKIYEVYGVPDLKNQFLFYTFFSALVLSVLVVWMRKESLSKFDVLFGLLLGIPNYFSARFLLLSLEALPAVLAYPTFSVATIVVVTLAGLLCFQERLTKRQAGGIGVILVALVLLNV